MIYYNSKIINKTGGNRVYYNGKIISQNVVKIKPITKDTLAFEFSGNEPYVYKVNNQDYTATTSPVNVDIVQDLGIQEFTSAENMFNGNFSLQKITHIPDTSKVTNMNQMFFTCTNLTTVNLSNINTSQVTNMSAMFGGCSKLKSLNLSNFNTSKVTKMGSMFLSCFDLTELDVSKFDTSNVTNMGQMFGGCSKLKNLDLSNFNTSKVEFLGKLFEGCNNLTTINLSNWNLDNNVLAIYDMFKGCTSLTKITMNDCTCETQQKIKDALKESGIPDGQVTIESNVPCDKPVENNILAFEFLTEVTAMEAYTINGKQYTATTSPFSIDIKKDLGVQEFTSTENMFNGSKYIAKITQLPDTSKVTNMTAMFKECANLREINQSHFYTSNVLYMNEMFRGCGLETLDLSYFNTSNVTDMAFMFYDCRYLKNVNLSNWDLYDVESMYEMFWGCYKLTTLNLSNWRNLEYFVNIRDMFHSCNSLKTIIMKNSDQKAIEMIKDALKQSRIPENQVTIITE